MKFLKKRKKNVKSLKTINSETETSCDSDEDWGENSAAKDKKKKAGEKTNKESKKPRIMEEEEESSSSSSSSSSSPSSESESETEEGEIVEEEGGDDDDDEGEVGADWEKLLSKEELATLTERQREELIFQRLEQREARRTRREIERKLALAKRRIDRGKPMAGDDGGDESDDDSGSNEEKRKGKKLRPRKAKVRGGKAEAMRRLKAIRERRKEKEKGANKAANTTSGKRRPQLEAGELDSEEKDSASSSALSEDESGDDGGSEADSAEEASRRPQSPGRLLKELSVQCDAEGWPTFEAVNTVFLSRNELDYLIRLPFAEFADAVEGRFVRAAFRTPQIHADDSPRHYKVCRVEGVETGKEEYVVGAERTQLILRISHGDEDTLLPGRCVSTKRFERAEYDEWRTLCGMQGISPPEVDEVFERMALRRQREYDRQREGERKRNRKEKRSKKAADGEDGDEKTTRRYPVNLALRKAQLLNERQDALEKGETERAAELQEALDALEERAAEQERERCDAIRAICWVNNRNRRLNVELAEEALKRETLEAKGCKGDDPFTRRNTRPRMVHRAGVDSQRQAAGDDGAAPAAPAAPEEPPPPPRDDADIILESCPSSGEGEETQCEPEGALPPLHPWYDFDLDIEVDLSLPEFSPSLIHLGPVVKSKVRERQRGCLNLDAYNRKMGFF